MKKTAFIIILIYSTFLQAQNAVFQKVDAFLEKGAYQKALLVLQQQPKTVAVLSKTAQIFHSIGNYSKEIDCYQKIIEKGTTNKIQLKLAKAFVLYGTYQKAIPVYEKIIEKDSSNTLVLSSLAKLYLKGKKNKKALKLYHILESRDTVNPYYSYQKGIAFERNRKFFKMGKSFLKAYKKDSTHFKSIVKLAQFFKKLKFKDSTMLFINKGLNIDTANVVLHMMKVTELFAQKKYDATLKSVDKIQKLGYTSPFIFEVKGMCYFKKKEYTLAEKAFQKALKLEFDNSKIHYRLANVYYQQKRNTLAKKQLLLSIFYAKPQLTNPYFLYGTICKQENNYPKAIEYFKKSYQNDTQNYKALFELAVACNAYYKDKKQALKYYEIFVDRFEKKEVAMTQFAQQQIKSIRKQHFVQGDLKK